MTKRLSNSLRAAALTATCAASLVALSGCASPHLDPRATQSASIGRFGPVAAKLQQDLTNDQSDKQYLLGRLNILEMTLAEGIPDAGEETANQLFALLRTQGINADKTVASVVFNEGVKVWKGEPFEQALAYHTIAMQKAMRGEWDNARAASESSLFLLKDFSAAVGKDAPPVDLAKAAAEKDKESAGSGTELLNSGYVAGQTDFALGYLVSGVASRALSRAQEANDNFAAAATANPDLADLAHTLRDGQYNTLLVVDYGLGPEKRAEGRDGVIATWRPRTSSINAPIHVAIRPAAGAITEDQPAGAFPVVQDINAMAQSHRWNNLEDVRAIKSAVGDVLITGGLVAASSSNRNNDAQWIGLAVAGLGLLMKGTATADTRHAELLPQRVYVLPLLLPQGESTVTVEVEGDGNSRVVLTGLTLPTGAQGNMQLRYIRIPTDAGEWIRSGAIVYANDFWRQPVPGDDLPYIFGGSDVSRPSPRVMERYQRAGHLTHMTQVDLENLYREEGITLSVEDQAGQMRRHILDGGDSLVPPLPGSVGYQRLFGQPHDAYKPKTDALKQAIEQESKEHPQPAN